MRKVFVSHYCNIPFHLLDKETSDILNQKGVYPRTLIEDLYTASFHLIRNFELAPYSGETSIEDIVSSIIEKENGSNV